MKQESVNFEKPEDVPMEELQIVPNTKQTPEIEVIGGALKEIDFDNIGPDYKDPFNPPTQ
mgnify:CR=1 FL=1